MSVHYSDDMVTLHHGGALEVARSLPAGSVQTIVTSPPYFGLRDYGTEDQLGAESSLGEYVDRLVEVFGALHRVLHRSGTLWLNLGDSYNTYAANRGPAKGLNKTRHQALQQVPKGAGLTTKDLGVKQLMGVPWRVAFALQDAGWILRADVVWAKANPMPESVTDRPTRAHEFVFLFAKSERYFYDADAIKEPDSGLPSGNGYVRPASISRGGRGQAKKWEPGGGRNKRDVWTVPTMPFPGAHFAVYPPELIRPCILAGSRPGDAVLDPFSGSGTTGMVANQEGRRYIGIDSNREYLDLSLRTRFAQPSLGIEVGS